MYVYICVMGKFINTSHCFVHTSLLSRVCVCLSLSVCVVIDHEVAHIASSCTEHAVLVNHVMICRMCSNSVP